MIYRERRLRRAERLREWAEKRAAKADGKFRRAHDLIKDIPLGQPILVGHHSERRHRRTLEKSDNAMRAAVESQHKAESMASRASNIEDAADNAIYSDDPDAIERLTEKIAGLEAQRERMTTANAAFRKSHRAEFKAAGGAYNRDLMVPFQGYQLQNLGGNITRLRKRLKFLSGSARTPEPITGDTATARAGLHVAAGMTTPSRPGKQPRPVWTVTGNIGQLRSVLIDLGGNFYRGAFSFWDDPTDELEKACSTAEQHHAEPAPPCEGRTIWNDDGTNGPVLICPPPAEAKA